MGRARRREMARPRHPCLQVVRRGVVLRISLSSLYYQRNGPSAEDLSSTNEMGRQDRETPFYGRGA